MNNNIDLHGIAHVINKFSPDLVALQEIDDKTNRSHGVDELKELANSTQMNHYFAPAMSYDGGHYGVGVITTKISGQNSILKHYFSIENSFYNRVCNSYLSSEISYL
jgi:endonuclease/exonuclease/phosphatase family metal-dependent hydrolase